MNRWIKDLNRRQIDYRSKQKIDRLNILIEDRSAKEQKIDTFKI